MNRRGFLRLFGASVAGLAVAEAIPLGRVWSFPSWLLPRRPTGNILLEPEWITREHLEILRRNLKVSEFFNNEWDREFARELAVGERISVRLPQCYLVGSPLAANEPSVAARVADPITRLARDGRPIGLSPIFDRASAFLESPREVRRR